MSFVSPRIPENEISERNSLECVLRERARERIKSGVLQMHKPAASYAGRGTGMPCVLCDQLIGRTDVEFELDFRDADGSNMVTVRMHFRCRLVWDSERAALADGAQ